MIYIERKIKIKRNQAKIEEPIVLYRGDMNIELRFIIENNPFKFNYRANTDVTYGQLIIKRPNAKPVFSEPVEMSESKVIFIVTGDMIDNLDADGNPADEEGAYDFQIQLLNSDQSSRGSLPEVTGGIIIKAPLCEAAAANITYVNKRNAYVLPADNVATFSLRNTDAIFDKAGNYIKTEWEGGDIITDDRLNKVEDALYQINDSIPTDYASESYVTDYVDYKVEKIEQAGYAKESYVNNMVRTNTEYIEEYMDDNYTKKSDMNLYATTDYVIDYTNERGYISQETVSDMIYSNNEYLEGRMDDKYTTEAYVDTAIDSLDYTTPDRVTEMISTNNAYIESYVSDKYATQNYVDEAIENIDVGGNIDLTGYATESYVNDAIANVELIPGPEGPQGPQGEPGKDADPADLEGYATEEYAHDYVDSAIVILDEILYEGATHSLLDDILGEGL